MKLTETLDADILELERQTGEAIRLGARPLIQGLATTGDYFEKLGAEDATRGYAQRPWEAFLQWGKKELPHSHGEDEPIVDLMYRCYLDGYNNGKNR